MISRVAESCFWLSRHLERLESSCRILQVQNAYLLDMSTQGSDRWKAASVILGENEHFQKLLKKGSYDPEIVQYELCWNADCVASLSSSLNKARENARCVREVLSIEFWEALNGLWLWYHSEQGKNTYDNNRYEFYRYVIERCLLLHGILQSSVCQDEAYEFLNLGLFLERASQTARTLDFKHHLLGPTKIAEESAKETTVWMMILLCCSAKDSYFRSDSRGLSGPDVVKFLLLDKTFPRSVRFCLEQAQSILDHIRHRMDEPLGEEGASLIGQVVHQLRREQIESVMERTIHVSLTDVVERVAKICEVLSREYFDVEVQGAV